MNVLRQVILNFHGIGTSDRPLESAELPYWVTPDFFAEVLLLTEHYKSHVKTDFTFDDGNLSDVAIAAPALERISRTATFFVLADRIGQQGSLGVGEIRALTHAGHSIGSHGAAHTDWKAADPAVLERELGPQTRLLIAEAASAPVTSAAIPFGRYNAAVLRSLRKHGYMHVYSSDGGTWRIGQIPIPRTSPRTDMTLADIESILLGRESLATRLRRTLARSVKKTL